MQANGVTAKERECLWTPLVSFKNTLGSVRTGLGPETDVYVQREGNGTLAGITCAHEGTLS